MERIRTGWKGEKPQELKALVGPVASGAAVLAWRPAMEEIAKQHRKLIGVEMETYGVFMAARVCSHPRPLAFSAKSICDFGDESKQDGYQRYAAFTSAQFLFEFAKAYL